MLVKAVIVTLLIIAVVSDDEVPIQTGSDANPTKPVCRDNEGDIVTVLGIPRTCKYVKNENHLCGDAAVKRECCRSCRTHLSCTDKPGEVYTYNGRRRTCAYIDENPTLQQEICQMDRPKNVCCLKCLDVLLGQSKPQPPPQR